MRNFYYELDRGTLRVRWLTEEEARLRAVEWGCPTWMVAGFQDRGDTEDLVICHDLGAWNKFHTIVHEIIHWVAGKLPRPLRRTVDYLLDGEWYG